jgi:hypothetical protein
MQVMEMLDLKIGDIFHGNDWRDQKVQLPKWDLSTVFVDKTHLSLNHDVW